MDQGDGPHAGPADSDARTPGRVLREAREAAGLSVEQVSASTCIRGAIVRDLEADRTGSSGGHVYARGHVRSIAVLVGSDPVALVALFDAASGVLPVAAAGPLTMPTPPTVSTTGAPASSRRPTRRDAPVRAGGLRVPVAARPERRGPHWLAAAVVAAGVLVVLIAVGTFTGGPRPQQGESALITAGAPPRPGTTQQPSAAAQPPAPDAVAQRPAPTGAELRVRLIGGSSWISVKGTRGRLFEGVLRSGQYRDFRDARKLTLIVGDAGSVSLVCGGKDLSHAGRGGSVKRFTCSAGGLVKA